MKNSFGAITLIVVGALALARNLGYLEVSITDLIMTWWPLILIGLGISFFFTPDTAKKRGAISVHAKLSVRDRLHDGLRHVVPWLLR